MIYWVSRSFCALLLKIFFGLKVTGRKHVPAHGGFILACNHVSFLDPVVAGVGCPRPLHYMARQTLFKNIFFGTCLTHLNTFPVKRDSADIASLREAMRRVRLGEGLLVFPEGTRKKEGISGRTKGGAGFLASKLGVPIVPVYIQGTEKALPRGKKFPRLSKITVRFGSRITVPQGVSYEEASMRVMDAVRKLSGGSSST